MCGSGNKECAICACGDGCVVGFRDDYFSPASERQLVERLNNNRYPDYRQLMIDTLKKRGHEYNGYEELEPLPEQQVCCTQIQNLCDTCRKKLICPFQHNNLRDKCELYEKLPNPLDEIINENTTRSLNPIKEEDKMEAWELVEQTRVKEEADAWKTRLKEEYAQLKERYEKLKAYNIKLEVKANIAKATPAEEEYYSNRLLARQQEIMADYLKVLELRATLAGIELS